MYCPLLVMLFDITSNMLFYSLRATTDAFMHDSLTGFILILNIIKTNNYIALYVTFGKYL